MKRRKFKSVIGASMAWLMLMTSGLTAYASGPGDINGDSVINAVDASEILSEYARVSTNQKAKLTDEQKKCADVDKNGDINAVDASQVLSYYAYKSTSGTMEFETYLKNPPVEINMPVNAEASSENKPVEFSVDGNSLTIKSDDKETKLHRVG